MKFTYDKSADGWTLLENTKPVKLKIKDLQLSEFLKNGEISINGDEMAKRAKESGSNFRQSEAEWLLKNQEKIPTEWQKYYIAFPGTVWRDSCGDRNVPFLFWRGDGWYLGFRWLEGDWDSIDRVLRSRKVASVPLRQSNTTEKLTSTNDKRLKP